MTHHRTLITMHTSVFFRLAGGLSPRSLATFVVQNAERRVEISSLVSCASPVLFHGIGQDVPLLRGFAG